MGSPIYYYDSITYGMVLLLWVIKSTKWRKLLFISCLLLSIILGSGVTTRRSTDCIDVSGGSTRTL
jgi:hypothetical protein